MGYRGKFTLSEASGIKLGDNLLKVHTSHNIGKPLCMSIGKPNIDIGILIPMDKNRTAFGQRLYDARKQAGLTQKQVRDKTGIAQGTLSELENDAQGSSFTAALAELYGVSAIYLAEGKKGVEDRRISRANVEAGPDIKGEYPLISWIQAGEWSSIVDNFNPGDAEAFFACPKKCSAETFMLRVRGRSMEPKYSDGDLIFVDPHASYAHGSNVVVKLTDDQEATFKRLVIDGSKQWLEPLNPDWPEKAIQIDDKARIVGVVIGKWVPD